MSYSPDSIKHLTALFRGDDSARAWLQRNKFPELILLHYSIEGKDEALRELTRLKHVSLVAFAHAVLGDTRAANWLAQNGKFEWAAVVSMVNKKDRNAEAWLIKHKLFHFVELGRTIRANEEETQEDDIFGLLKKFIFAFRKK